MEPRYKAVPVLCPNQICEEREHWTDCYQDTGMHCYQNCKTFQLWDRFQKRHNHPNSFDRKV